MNQSEWRRWDATNILSMSVDFMFSFLLFSFFYHHHHHHHHHHRGRRQDDIRMIIAIGIIIAANVAAIIQNIRKTDFMQMLFNVISIIMDNVSDFLIIYTIAELNRRSRAENVTMMALFLTEPL